MNFLLNKRDRLVVLLAAATGLVFLFPGTGHAYLDPNITGWLFQLMFPVFVAVTGTWALFRQRILSLRLHLLFWRDQHGDPETAGLAPSCGKVRTLLMLPSVVTGILLPVNFLANANGILGYLRMWELFPVFGWSWFFCAVAGMLFSLFVYVFAVFTERLMKKQSMSIAEPALLCISLFLALLGLLKGGDLWVSTYLRPHGGLSRQFYVIAAVAVFAGCLFWIARSRRTAFDVVRYAQFIASVGLVLTLVAPGVTLIKGRSSKPLQPMEQAGMAGKKRPDIIFVTFDALAASHMSVYGYNRDTTPNIIKFAEQANIYDRFYASSNFTTSSISSILYGVRPWTHRALQLYGEPIAPATAGGLVEELKAAGYRTYAIATNLSAAPFHNLSKPYFDEVHNGKTNEFIGLIAIVIDKFPHMMPLLSFVPYIEICEFFDRVILYSGIYTHTNHFDSELALSSVRRILTKRSGSEPVFIWAHLYAPHSPYATAKPFIGKFDPSSQHRSRFDSTPPWCYAAGADKSFPGEFVGRYDESIAYIDSHVGGLLAWLKSGNIYDNALIVLSADHGESFSHGYGAHSGPSLNEDLIHVPLIIKEPGQKKGERISFLAEQVDLKPTILKYAGLDGTAKGEGIAINGSAHPEAADRPVFSMNLQQNYSFGELNTGTVAMLYGDWKYVHYFGNIQHPSMPALSDALYDLRSDPGENVNLASIQPEMASRMIMIIEQYLSKYGAAVE